MSKKLTHVNRPGGVTILLSSLEFKYAFHAQVISAYINTRAKWPQRNPSHTSDSLVFDLSLLLFRSFDVIDDEKVVDSRSR